jgi:hypothetical protein
LDETDNEFVIGFTVTGTTCVRVGHPVLEAITVYTPPFIV